ncbi:MAG: FKBP-type peptidyl-prolyl cis-trans isomerase [Bacteroidota bacterium]|nr:FKBP-type peptidyl-prolyl cis-trans isomerase [Bacteroidota bacterium]
MKTFFIFAILFFTILSNTNAQDTITTEGGLKYIIIEKGDGAPAEKNKAVEVHYTGYLLDGKMFDTSRERGEPIEFVLGTGKVIKGWDEAIAMMNVGDKYRLIIPSELAYGKKGAGNIIPPDATLVFDVELMSVSDPKQSIADVLYQTMIAKDIQAAIDQYKDLKTNSIDKYNFKENQLNALGYQLMQDGKIMEAIEFLKLNVESYPNSSNVYDSMGEAYMLMGNNELAIVNYKKSLEMDPSNNNAIERLEKLQK